MTQKKELPWILLVTHGKLGEALVESVEMIAGKLKNITTIALMPQMPPEELTQRVKEALQKMRSEQVLIMVDLFGGTPANICAGFAKQGYAVLSGVNLPLLLGAEMYRASGNWEQILPYLQNEVGVKSIINITELIKNREERKQSESGKISTN